MCDLADEIPDTDTLLSWKRPGLQKLCKRVGLKANGKVRDPFIKVIYTVQALCQFAVCVSICPCCVYTAEHSNDHEP